MAFCWRDDDGPTLNAGLVVVLRFLRGSGPVLLENPIFVIFQWGGGGKGPDPLSPPPLDPHANSHELVQLFRTNEFVSE